MAHVKGASKAGGRASECLMDGRMAQDSEDLQRENRGGLHMKEHLF